MTVEKGETLAVVGESGSGKSTLARCIVRLTEPTAGRIVYDTTIDVRALRGRALRDFRRQVQMVFQNPAGSLDPGMRVGHIVGQPLRYHEALHGDTLRHRVHQLLEAVGLSPAEARKFPHQLSGGQQQRVSLARAISTRPRLLVLDEPTSALDASVQEQILELLAQLREEFGLTYILISHDLRIIERYTDRTAVFFRGHLVELGPTSDVVGRPRHPYMRLLVDLIPSSPPNPDAYVAASVLMRPSAPDPAACPFLGQCPISTQECAVNPSLQEYESGRLAACVWAADTQVEDVWAEQMRHLNADLVERRG